MEGDNGRNLQKKKAGEKLKGKYDRGKGEETERGNSA